MEPIVAAGEHFQEEVQLGWRPDLQTGVCLAHVHRTVNHSLGADRRGYCRLFAEETALRRSVSGSLLNPADASCVRAGALFIHRKILSLGKNRVNGGFSEGGLLPAAGSPLPVGAAAATMSL